MGRYNRSLLKQLFYLSWTRQFFHETHQWFFDFFFAKNHNRKVLKLESGSLETYLQSLDSWWPIQNKWLQMYVQNMRKTNTEKNSKYLGFIVFGKLSFVTKINKIFLWRKNPSENWCEKYDLKQTQQPSCTNLNHISNFAKILIIWEHSSKSSSNSSATNAYTSLYAQQSRYTIPIVIWIPTAIPFPWQLSLLWHPNFVISRRIWSCLKATRWAMEFPDSTTSGTCFAKCFHIST